MSRMKIAIVGAGGFAREVAWLIRDINSVHPTFDLMGHLVSDLGKLNDTDSHDQVLGDFDWLHAHPQEIDGLVFGIGTPQIKLRLSEMLELEFPNHSWPSLVHPSVRFDRETAVIEHGVVLCAGSIATVNITFGRFSMVNLMCTIGHESIIGAGAVLNPTVNISGGVRIGSGVLVGTGAQVLQYIEIGDNATIGAGAVVSRPVESGQTVVGIPAKPLQKK
jgi:sugar O-acyltransferase (sialic acid O-acetyltransferase NeuD family)